MLRWLIGGFLSLAVSAHAAGGMSNQTPLSLRDKGKPPSEKVRVVSISDLRPTGVHGTAPCRLRFVDPFFGHLGDDDYYASKMPFQMGCFENSDKIAEGSPTRFNGATKKWVRHFEGRISGANNAGLSPSELKKLDRAIHFFELSSVNASGFAYTEDDVTGEERYRVRWLHYCLIRPPTALCGTGNMGLLKDGPKADLTSYAMRILRSVEFLDDSPSPSSSPASSAAPISR